MTHLLIVHMIIDKAAPVQQVHHGLEAEDGLPRQAGVVWHHGRAGLQLDGLICFCPSKLLKPHLRIPHSQSDRPESIKRAANLRACLLLSEQTPAATPADTTYPVRQN